MFMSVDLRGMKPIDLLVQPQPFGDTPSATHEREVVLMGRREATLKALSDEQKAGKPPSQPSPFALSYCHIIMPYHIALPYYYSRAIILILLLSYNHSHTITLIQLLLSHPTDPPHYHSHPLQNNDGKSWPVATIPWLNAPDVLRNSPTRRGPSRAPRRSSGYPGYARITKKQRNLQRNGFDSSTRTR